MLTKITNKSSQQGIPDRQARVPGFAQRRQTVSPRTNSPGDDADATVGHDFYFGNIPILQPKLTIGQANDKYEQEADRVAEQVVSMRESTFGNDADIGPVSTAGRNGLQRLCRGCAGHDDEETLRRSPATLPRITPMTNAVVSRYKFSDLNDSEPPKEGEPEIALQSNDEMNVRKKAAPGSGIQVNSGEAAMTTTDQLQHSIERRSNSGGSPLIAESQRDMESRFGHDFSKVRIHADGAAGNIARQVNARAFTYGNHVYFAPGEYRPHSNNGKRLLAHELTHVVQQGMQAGGIRAKRIQRTEAETLRHCPPYWRWETPRNIETYNCAGLAHRTYDYKNLQNTVTLLAAGQTACSANKIKHWLWRYNVHLEDYQGNRLTSPSPDFHTVAGMVDPRGNDPQDVYSKNGKRPVYGPGTGPGFRPPAKVQARENNANERPATDQNGRPIYKLRSNFQTTVVCVNCPSPRR